MARSECDFCENRSALFVTNGWWEATETETQKKGRQQTNVSAPSMTEGRAGHGAASHWCSAAVNAESTCTKSACSSCLHIGSSINCQGFAHYVARRGSQACLLTTTTTLCDVAFRNTVFNRASALETHRLRGGREGKVPTLSALDLLR